MLGLNVWFSIRDIRFSDERKHRRYLIDLSENEQRLHNNERERAELEEVLVKCRSPTKSVKKCSVR